MIDIDRFVSELSGVNYILVGGAAAAVHGAAVSTKDIDILYDIEEFNIIKLKSCLDRLSAVFRDDARKLPVQLSHLETKGHKLTDTVAGRLDVLGTINPTNLTYADIFPDSELVDYDGISVRVVTAKRLLALKREMGRPKDLIHVMLLEAAIDEKDNSTSIPELPTRL